MFITQLEVMDPSLVVYAEGFFLGGLKLYILKKIKDAIFGEKNITLISNLAQVKRKNSIMELAINPTVVRSAPAIWKIKGLSVGRFAIHQRETLNIDNVRSFHTKVNASKRIGPHNEDIISVLVGSLLGDPTTQKRYHHNTHNLNTLVCSEEIKSDKIMNWITGFCDGESSFKISILKNSDRAIGWAVKPTFSIELHGKDLEVLKLIKSYFGVGNIIISKRNGHAIYNVKSVKDINSAIIPHFEKYPLLTQKWGDFVIFKNIVELINLKQHLTIEGLEKIVELRVSLNKGLSKELAKNFPTISGKAKPVAQIPENISMNWITGFIDGEGCFYVGISKDKTKTGFSIKLNLKITQHIRDKLLFKKIQDTLGCGRVYESSEYSRVDFMVTNLSELSSVILPLFYKYPLRGSKSLDLKDFIEVVKLIENKEHLREEGLEKIKQIKSGMNTGRDYNMSQGSVTREKTLNPISFSKIQTRSFHTKVKANKRIGPHNEDILSVIVGSLLGKGGNRRTVEGTRFCYRQSIVHEEYLFWLYDFFYTRGYCSNLKPRKYTRMLKNQNNKEHFGYEFNTFTFRSFNWIYDMFYRKGKKIIRPELKNYLTPLALAVWAMSSGNFINGCIELSVGRLSELKDIVTLADMFKRCFGLVCSISKPKNQYVIVISKEYVKIFQSIVSPYIIPTLKYKIGLKTHSNYYYNRALLSNSFGNRFYSTSNEPSCSHNSSYVAATYSNPISLKYVIYKENHKKAGIYRWTNLITGETYIGSSSNLAKRFSSYFSSSFLTREASKTKSIIYSGLLKYGHNNFKLEVLEYCDSKVLIHKEQHYLDLYCPKYNILTKAGSTLGYKHTDETLSKFKLRKLSIESLEKLRSHLSNFNQELNIKKRIKVDIHDFSTDITTCFESVVEAANAIQSESKTLLEKGKYEQVNKDVIPYKGRYVITILREGITRAYHLKKVELARNNIFKGLANWKDALGKQVVVTNVVTNDSVSYNTISDAASALNVSRRTISRRIEDQKVLNDLYRIYYA